MKKHIIILTAALGILTAPITALAAQAAANPLDGLAEVKNTKARAIWRAQNAAFLNATIAADPLLAKLPEKEAERLGQEWLLLNNPPGKPWTKGADLAKARVPRFHISQFATAAEIGQLPADPKFAGSVWHASRRLNDPALADTFFASIQGKGCLEPNYTRWFKARMRTLNPSQSLAMINLELRALLSSSSPSLKTDAWIEHLQRAQRAYKNMAQ